MRAAFFCVLVDPADDIAGFILDWIRALAARLESLEVVVLEDRTAARPVDLPANVRLHSLGKEKGSGRARLLLASQVALGRALGRADFLLCHMMPLYALVSWPLCRLRGRPLFLWYTHQHVDLKLRAAVRLADRVFTAAPESMRLATDKKRVLGHGINTARFSPGPPDRDGDRLRVVTVGRISPVKRLEVLIEAAEKLKEMGELDSFEFKVIGREGTPAQRPYVEGLRARIEAAGLGQAFDLAGHLPYARIDRAYRAADVFVSTQEQRGLDKAVLEAMASGLPAVVANESFRPLLAGQAEALLYPADQPAALAERLLGLSRLAAAERRRLGLELRERVRAGHDLERFMDRILEEARGLVAG